MHTLKRQCWQIMQYCQQGHKVIVVGDNDAIECGVEDKFKNSIIFADDRADAFKKFKNINDSVIYFIRKYKDKHRKRDVEGVV